MPRCFIVRSLSIELGSGQHRLDNLACDIRQPKIAAIVAIGQSFVIDAEQVQDGRVQVVDADSIDHGLEADFIRLTMVDAAANAGAGEPGGERVRIVVAARLGVFLRQRQPTEFTSPDDQRRIEKSAALQVRQEPGDWRIGLFREASVIAEDVHVAVPTKLVVHSARVDLHAADASFDQASGDQTLAGEMRALGIVGRRAGESRRLAVEIKGFWRRNLHAVGEFERFTRRQLGLVGFVLRDGGD